MRVFSGIDLQVFCSAKEKLSDRIQNSKLLKLKIQVSSQVFCIGNSSFGGSCSSPVSWSGNPSRKNQKMSLSSLVLAAFVTFAFTQLAIEQHTALMAFYDAVGCNASRCPRFLSHEPCPSTSGLTCLGSNVHALCKLSVWLSLFVDC
jgi:hypothetical protein